MNFYSFCATDGLQVTWNLKNSESEAVQGVWLIE